MTIRELYCALDEMYPRSLSCSWDNDGLMVCSSPDTEVKRVLLALDASNEAIAYAIQRNDIELLVSVERRCECRPARPSTPCTRISDL